MTKRFDYEKQTTIFSSGIFPRTALLFAGFYIPKYSAFTGDPKTCPYAKISGLSMIRNAYGVLVCPICVNIVSRLTVEEPVLTITENRRKELDDMREKAKQMTDEQFETMVINRS